MESLKLFVVFNLLITFTQTYGKPNFLVTIDSLNCIVSPDYADPPTCYMNNTANPPRGTIDIQMHRSVISQKYELQIDITTNKKKRTVVHIIDDSCKFFEGSVSGILRIIKKIIDGFGTLPKKCPTDKNFRYLFQNITVDYNQLPSFLTECDVHFITKNTEKNALIFQFDAKGKIRRNK